MRSKPFFQNIFILKRPRAAIFADIIKIITIIIKTIFKDSKKIKRIRHYESKCNLYLYFLILLISNKKVLMSAVKIKNVSRDSYSFWIFLK